MLNTVKAFSVEYNPVNKDNTFAGGDLLAGNVLLELGSDCSVTSLHVKLKGKARVRWTETYGKTVVAYFAKEKFFSIKHFVLQQHRGQDSTVVAQGSHVYPFTFQIPSQDLPSSFDGKWGRIRYSVKAFLSRPLKMDSKAKAKFNIVSKTNPNCCPGLVTPQHEHKDKKMNLFNSGKVVMDVNLDKMGYCQGQGIKVTAFIQNSSSREIKPKYCLYRKVSFFAEGKRKVSTKDLLKEVGEPIPPSCSQNVSRTVTIPHSTGLAILNCNIIKVEYRLRVYLDVKYASDPEIKFHIVVLPASETPDPEEPPTFGGFWNPPEDKERGPGWSQAVPNPASHL